MFLNAIKNIFVVLLLILVGVYSGKKKYINENVNEGLNKLVLNVSLPSIILASFKTEYNTPEVYSDIFILCMSVLILKSSLFIFGRILFKKKYDKFYSPDRFSLIFSNSAYMGLPIVLALFGNKALIYASIYSIFFNLLCNTVGVSIFSDSINKKNFFKIFLNTQIIASLIGLVLFSLKLNLPFVLDKTLTTVGGITTPLSFLSLGYSLTTVNFKKLFNVKKIYLVCILRLLLIPTIAYFIISLFSPSKILLNTFVVLEAMPVAVVCLIFSNMYKSEDSTYTSKLVFISTTLSLITIPFIILLLSLIK